MTCFGVLAVALAAIGLYAVMAFNVARRTREIGIRMALGASRQAILAASLRSGMILASAGLAIGVALSLAVTRLLSFMLYEVSPSDPITFVAAGALLPAVALAACWMRARRAARVDPMVALRYE